MSKKSNKTSHVLNLLTNRTGLNPEKLEQGALSEVGELDQGILILPEGAVEIQADTIEIKTEKVVETLVTNVSGKRETEHISNTQGMAPGYAEGAMPQPPPGYAAGAMPQPPQGYAAGAMPQPPSGYAAGAMPQPPQGHIAGALFQSPENMAEIISDKIRIRLEAIEIQEAEARVKKTDGRGGCNEYKF